MSFSALELFHFARTIRGCVYGSTDPLRRHPEDPGLRGRRVGSTSARWSSGTVGLDGIEGAFEDMAAGRGARTLVVP